MALAEQLEKIVAGNSLYLRMKSEFDYSQILWTMKRYNEDMSAQEADGLLDAFLQWIALTPWNTEEKFVTMFQTPVEEAFHCFVLNTRLYSDFCHKFLGFFFHHDPLVEESGDEIAAMAKYTVELLESEYGGSLNENLKLWRVQFDSGDYKVACAGPGGSCH